MAEKIDIQERLVKTVTYQNWILLAASMLAGLLLMPMSFNIGLLSGGLLVTINFHLLYRTLKKAFRPERLSSHNRILVKYYIRFVISGIILFILITRLKVDLYGLLIGLSIVVASVVLATLFELKQMLSKEAV